MNLSIEVEPELRRRVKLAATSRDETVWQWSVAAIQRELERDAKDDLLMPEPGAKPRVVANSSKPRSG